MIWVICTREDISFKCIMTFRNKSKLSPYYVGPFEVLERTGVVVYLIALPPAVLDIHNSFHVSMLRKYEPDPF